MMVILRCYTTYDTCATNLESRNWEPESEEFGFALRIAIRSGNLKFGWWEAEALDFERK